jgi:hypothetical protein
VQIRTKTSVAGPDVATSVNFNMGLPDDAGPAPCFGQRNEMLNALSNLGVETHISYVKRRSALVSIIGGILFVVAASFILTKPRPGDNQPVYKDRTLVQWLDVGYDGRVNGKDATPIKSRRLRELFGLSAPTRFHFC